MEYTNIQEAIFLARPNRFIALCLLQGVEVVCHVKNTGRCRELLVQGTCVYLEKSSNPSRKTKYDLVAVKKGELLINMDSNAPNLAVGEWLRSGALLPAPTLVRPETKYGNSRFDFYVETASEKAFIEVKGVTLEKDGVAMFPDAPTVRGTKHINELVQCMADGYRAYLILVIQMKGAHRFCPNAETDPPFATALQVARREGVQLLAMDCVVTPTSMVLDQAVTIQL